MGDSSTNKASNGTVPDNKEKHATFVVTTDGAAIDGEMLHAAENHRGRSSSFSTKENIVHEDAVKFDSPHSPIPNKTIVGAVLLLLISYFTYPDTLQPIGEPTVHHVFYYGWITAISTGFGVLPLVFVPDLDKFWIGVSNAVAAGMMTAASYSLITEGCTCAEPDDTSEISSTVRTAIGVALGLTFILCTKKFLDTHEDLKVGTLDGADARKVILIMFVMTLHSFSEGVGIGVSFGGEHGNELGLFISASLAVHNVPEGLAVAIVLLPRKVSKLTAALWCVVTSIPQPMMAVPAFLFVHHFIPVLPVGLGFAGGAMAWVAFVELLVEAYEDTDLITTGVISTISLVSMMTIQNTMHP
mmetsp:Transcript_53884/g.80061  ORF Transcript_53884/g.80061 Transcript_53884/m.80061 type:complete len:357 (-) Transcript_53884:87-1157(-)|eukprot:CAMPEP_0195521458 /NCGR_PEP_ID=MMETSP0794_2-20130614/18716_1 /TAXON_ID=515487 /ORGANISM="Stephanopyxis turris, Strain CCMP 815" /LENGTH=356 /DNA_ID=CAMNT_0040651021 /DNA_START=325 /DNA_END=1398 /DNA_ORIENTATION=-